MKKLLIVFSFILFTSCGVEWQYVTLNTHAAQVDAIYRSSDYRFY